MNLCLFCYLVTVLPDLNFDVIVIQSEITSKLVASPSLEAAVEAARH